MKELKKIWAFGIPYLKPYRFRFVLGIILSIIFGLSNGLFVLSVNTLFNRLAPPASSVVTPAKQEISTSHPESESSQKSFSKKLKVLWKEKTVGFADYAKALPDKLLPRMGQPVTWLQMLGGFFLLPLVMGSRAMASYFSTYCLTLVSARVIRDMQVAALRKAQ